MGLCDGVRGNFVLLLVVHNDLVLSSDQLVVGFYSGTELFELLFLLLLGHLNETSQLLQIFIQTNYFIFLEDNELLELPDLFFRLDLLLLVTVQHVD
eukprot:CAMPEP_0170556924 /NCGR_PEP_ID=MMETSP0211-20121228/19061_1 /TAXON_ID=311385 /ORGANISM="Pseudokeronopsis sp., Strain OXSARD2" /LENGTH=96 /DNA_ID=CAMNT_0010867547 /DNA_START=246 /DNA_END=536 /DNA_ORIENTATION=-